MSANTIYSPLDATKRQIRILHLPAGEEEDDLCCTFSIVSLDDDPDYEALSYVWGDENDTIPVQVEGQTMNITKNLYTALKDVRMQRWDRFIWADALCINQSDLSERESQVALMTDIYSQTSCVVCYLGEFATDRIIGLLIVRKLGEDENLHLPSWRTPGLDIGGHRGFESPWVHKYLGALFNLPWWTRVWTLQEFILAKRAVLQCGRFPNPAETVFAFLENVDRHLYTCCREQGPLYFYFKHPQSGKTLPEVFEDTVYKIVRYRAFKIPPFCFTLALFRDRNAKDIRDKVYGMLGLAPDMNADVELLPVDYNNPPEKVFMLTAVAEFGRRSSLDPLSYCYGEKKLTLPSWVPDWTATVRDSHKRSRWAAHIYYYKAAGKWGTGRIDRVECGPGWVITPQGIVFDAIEDCGRVLQGDADRPFINEIREIAYNGRAGTDCYASGKQTMEEAFNVALFGGLKPTWIDTAGKVSYSVSMHLGRAGRIEKISPSPEFDAWEKGLDRDYMTQPEVAFTHMNAQFECVAFDRRLVRTTKGYIGFGPATCEKGDMVVVISGGKVPYVLRPEPNGNFFTLVGDAYIHGIMYGEAVEGIEDGDQRLRGFRIR